MTRMLIEVMVALDAIGDALATIHLSGVVREKSENERIWRAVGKVQRATQVIADAVSTLEEATLAADAGQ